MNVWAQVVDSAKNFYYLLNRIWIAIKCNTYSSTYFSFLFPPQISLNFILPFLIHLMCFTITIFICICLYSISCLVGFHTMWRKVQHCLRWQYNYHMDGIWPFYLGACWQKQINNCIDHMFWLKHFQLNPAYIGPNSNSRFHLARWIQFHPLDQWCHLVLGQKSSIANQTHFWIV